jgi:hypothetical protein
MPMPALLQSRTKLGWYTNGAVAKWPPLTGSGPNPKYFSFQRGVTYHNLVSNRFTGLNAVGTSTA